MDCDTIDLNQVEQATSSVTTSDKKQGYRPRTLQQQHNNGRYAYLPIFPTTSVVVPNDCLLLANVPG
ncbi:unnamed protein product, partial [Rotaria sp. Silwood2]